MPCLYLLCVGIDEYAGPVNSLNGCVNDAEAYTEYFKLVAHQRGWEFAPLLLRNADATRAGVISAFDHFTKATEDDFCIWTYSGHGSRCPAPPEFWHQNPDRKHRSIVCHDSRTENGSDLVDKELSWLIWRATRKKPHFLVLTDCCFSGQNLRLEGDVDRSVRFDRNSDPKPLRDYLGIEDYPLVDGQYRSPPRGRYLQLAASHRDQPALERAFDSGTHGLFTYKLLEELKSIGRPISYRELFYRVKAAVSISCQKQAPQMDNYEGFSQQATFLSAGTAGAEQLYWLYYNREKMQWRINVGSTLGIQKGKTFDFSSDNNEQLTLTILRAHPFYSILEEIPGLNLYQFYPINLSGLLPKSLTVSFSPSISLIHKKALRLSLEAANLEYASWQNSPEAADCWVSYDDRFGLGLFARNENRPMFQRLPISRATEFWGGVDRVARWHFIKTFSNPETRLSDKSVQLEFNTVSHDEVKTEVPWDQPVRLIYDSDDDEYPEPAYALKVVNTSQKPLHLSALFLSNTYAITNCLLEGKSLQPGEFTYLKLEMEDEETTIITNQIEDFLWEYGIVENVELLQVLVATVPIDTHQFNQLELHPDSKKSIVRTYLPRIKRPPDWTVFSIQLNTLRPYPVRFLSDRSPVIWFDHRLEAPPGFTAQTNLYPISFLEEFLGQDMAEAILFRPEPYFWTPGYNIAPGLCLLQLKGQRGAVSANEPFRIALPEPISELSAFAYDSTTNTFLKLVTGNKNNVLSITSLPPLETSIDVRTGTLIILSV